MDSVIEVQHLTKQFPPVTAVDDLSFFVRKGEVFGFLGQNGAGKSTTIRMLLTLVHPTRGDIRIFGNDLQKSRRLILQKIGAIIERPDLYNYLTALQNIAMMAKLSGVAKTKQQLLERLELVGLAGRVNSKVKTFSQGMKQRLGMACALVHDPQLIILDEPTNGLDPQGIAEVRQLILHLSRNENKTVLVSSHLLSEVEVIADSMLIIDRGKKLISGRVGDLLNPADTLVYVETANPDPARSLLLQSQWGAFLQPGEQLSLKMHRAQIPHLVKFLVDNNMEILSVQPKHSLEHYFLSLTTTNSNVAAYKD